MAGHAVPFESLYDFFGRCDFGKTPFEAVRFTARVFDESPVSATRQFEFLDYQLVTSTPPLRDEAGVCHRFPHSLAWRIEDSLDADVAVAGSGDLGFLVGLCLGSRAHRFSFVRSRNSPSRLRRPSRFRRY